MRDALALIAVPLGTALIIFSGYRFLLIQLDISRMLPPAARQPEAVRYYVDPFVWGIGGSRQLRRRYVQGQAAMVLGCALIAFGLWSTRALPFAFYLLVFGTLIAAQLGYRLIKHRKRFSGRS